MDGLIDRYVCICFYIYIYNICVYIYIGVNPLCIYRKVGKRVRSRRARRVYYTTSHEHETEIESGGRT